LGETLVEVDVPPGVGVCVAQFCQESHGLVVGGGLLGGDICLDLLPDGFGVACESGETLGPGGGPFVFGAPTALGTQGMGGVQEMGG
jgi:hypothetical protein